MSTAIGHSVFSTGGAVGSLTSDLQAMPPQWHAVYTNSRHEKTVARQMEERQIETFLPVYRNWHRWKDRRKLVELALFPGYVFVKIPAQDKLRVLQVYGVVNLVTFNGQLAVVPQEQITALRNGLENDVCAEPCPYLKVGKKVRVVRGPMAGTEGILVRKREKYRFVLSIDVLMRSVAVEVDAGDVKAVALSVTWKQKHDYIHLAQEK